MKRQLDLSSLMLFYEVVQCGSLAAAGTKLKVAKSTVSRRLSRLEQEVGSVLPRRGGRKLTLTEIGAGLHERCQRIASEIEQASNQALGTNTKMQGTLRISVPDLGVSFLGGVISEFVRQFPEIDIDVRMHYTDIVDPFEEPFDIVIQVGEKKPLRSVCRRLATLSRGVYASPAYLKRCGTVQTIEQCAGLHWIVTDVQERDGVWLSRGGSYGRQVSVRRKVIANNARLAKELAIGGVGLALIPDVLCRSAVQQGRLSNVLTDWRAPPLQVFALFLSRDRIPRKTRVFLEFFAETISGGSR